MSLLTRTALLLAMLSILTTPVPAHAQSDAGAIEGDLPIESYLSLLTQVAPAARDGAEAYMAAFRKRCGRALQTVELRRAFAEGSGDPTLMAMVRATHGWSVLLSALAGGLLLLLADLLARGLIAPQEMPVGVLTAVLGGGYLLWRMSRMDVTGGRA